MKKPRNAPEVNAGSMADIAFLLLIFFLVTASIEKDKGLNRLLPQKNNDTVGEIKIRNLFDINLNGNDEILAKGEKIKIEELQQKVISFIDNGGIRSDCSYCKGPASEGLSENPEKAIVSINSQRTSSYPAYVQVQNEVLAAYNHLRNREAMARFGLSFEEMKEDYYDDKTPKSTKGELKEKIEKIQKLFPQKILEPEIINPQ